MSATHMKVHTQGSYANPVLLFLHAFPFSAEMWRDQMNLFSEKFYCVAPDLPGFGTSTLPEHAMTFEGYVDAVLDYLQEQKIEKAMWCGLSMGGYMALRMYERAPEQCRGLILCDTKASADGNEAKVKRWDSIKLLQKSQQEFNQAQWKALIGESSQGNTDLKTRFQEIVSSVSAQGVAQGLVALATRTDSTESLAKISVPTLILVGEEDKVTPVKDAEVLHKGITGSKMKVIEKTGHLSNLESPKRFNDHLSDFLFSLN